ncbi:MAG: flagellar filament capping protein FliD, partial [Spirochaetia bacterium]|nr:flagellar filament capping protein FliD [Spirochaetia bacterium]
VILDAEAKGETAPGKDTAGGKESVVVGPGIQVDVSGVKLHGYDVDRTRETGEKPAPETLPPVYGVGVVWTENGRQQTKEIKWENGDKRHESIEVGKLTGGKAADAFYVFVDTGSAAFSGLKIVETKPGAGLQAANVTQQAQDARIKMNGVEISRSNNTKLTDIIDGVSLNLNKTTAGLIHVTVSANSDDIVTRLKEWVAAYNDLLKFCRTNSSVEKKKFDWDTSGGNKDLSEGLRQVQGSVGIFATDSNIRQLVGGLRAAAGNAYPSDTDPAFKVLADIGITTGDVGKEWEEIQAGYLVVDEDKLRRVLGTAPGSVKELFASERKFGRMESAIRQSKASGDQMRNSMRQGGME